MVDFRNKEVDMPKVMSRKAIGSMYYIIRINDDSEEMVGINTSLKIAVRRAKRFAASDIGTCVSYEVVKCVHDVWVEVG